MFVGKKYPQLRVRVSDLRCKTDPHSFQYAVQRLGHSPESRVVDDYELNVARNVKARAYFRAAAKYACNIFCHLYGRAYSSAMFPNYLTRRLAEGSDVLEYVTPINKPALVRDQMRFLDATHHAWCYSVTGVVYVDLYLFNSFPVRVAVGELRTIGCELPQRNHMQCLLDLDRVFGSDSPDPMRGFLISLPEYSGRAKNVSPHLYEIMKGATPASSDSDYDEWEFGFNNLFVAKLEAVTERFFGSPARATDNHFDHALPA
jgi:hypothetical protein